MLASSTRRKTTAPRNASAPSRTAAGRGAPPKRPTARRSQSETAPQRTVLESLGPRDSKGASGEERWSASRTSGTLPPSGRGAERPVRKHFFSPLLAKHFHRNRLESCPGKPKAALDRLKRGAASAFPGKLRVPMSEGGQKDERDGMRDGALDLVQLRSSWPDRRDPRPPEDEAGPAEIVLGALRRHMWLAISLLIASVVVAASIGMSRTKVYRASATLQIDPRPPTPLGHGVEGVVELGTNSY